MKKYKCTKRYYAKYITGLRERPKPNAYMGKREKKKISPQKDTAVR